MMDCDPRQGRYLAACAVFRGNVSTKEVEQHMMEAQDKHSNSFVDWMPHNLKICQSLIAPPGQRLGGTLIANTTALSKTFSRRLKRFSKLLERKAFMHWYLEEMDELEFMEAASDIQDLVEEYQECQNA